DAECARAKGSLRGGLVLGLEDSGSRMNRIGRSELSYGNHRSVSETLARIDAVTTEEVAAVASTQLSRPFAASVTGPYRRTRDLLAAVRRLVAEAGRPRLVPRGGPNWLTRRSDDPHRRSRSRRPRAHGRDRTGCRGRERRRVR